MWCCHNSASAATALARVAATTANEGVARVAGGRGAFGMSGVTARRCVVSCSPPLTACTVIPNMWRRSFSTTDGPFKYYKGRSFSTTDGPFKYYKGKTDTFKKNRKKHYNEVLVFADRRKLLEVAQDLLNGALRDEVKPAFWEIYAKRCIKSMHLLTPLEIAIVLRSFDVYDVQLRGADVFAAAASFVRASKEVSGQAVVVLVDVFSRRLKVPREEMQDLLEHLGRQAANAMWEITPRGAVDILSTMSAVGAQDSALSARVARKVLMQLDVPGVLALEDLPVAAQAMAAQNHRDVDLLRGIATRIETIPMHEDAHAAAAVEDAVRSEAAGRILASLEALEFDDVPLELQRLASRSGVKPAAGPVA
eukprot:TRINITY_DN2828_c0_g1_i1.p1 TRINITY_DN2828_c0_g1~~TRINITY_DN2828_c0_g1_i1.p1  ORF type:complete len:365 (-),score=72.94 TRINITY_DN2828_c0_g1_i1:38-1132(-)